MEAFICGKDGCSVVVSGSKHVIPGDLIYIPSSVILFREGHINEKSSTIMKKLDEPCVGVFISPPDTHDTPDKDVGTFLFGNYCKILIEGVVWHIEDENVFPHNKGSKELLKG